MVKRPDSFAVQYIYLPGIVGYSVYLRHYFLFSPTICIFVYTAVYALNEDRNSNFLRNPN